MVPKEEAKKEILKIIEFYNKNQGFFDKAAEHNIRKKLLDRLFSVLGWDVDGRENPEEVTMEETILMKESKKKRADYTFRLNGIPRFVTEAKAIKGITLDLDDFREQVVGYAYNIACSWAVLTNFARTIIFFVDRDDNTVIRDIRDFTDLANFDKNFENIWFLSKEAVQNELLEKDTYDRGIKPQKEKVFKQLFSDLTGWREKLSEEIKRNYREKYESYEIEEIVQRIIDRLIFIRKIEDMKLEERKLDQLTRRFNEGTTYKQLKKIFEYYRDKYNSGLFGEEGENQECDRIDIQDRAIESIIRGMYIPNGRKIEYDFDAIGVDILGSIYEQYLSFILKDTPKRAKLEGGRAHKKEQGIYYTPQYIVKYIVRNAVGERIKDVTIDEILATKILDPACGSGSFLIEAFSEVCKGIEDRLKKGERSKKSITLSTYSKRLTLSQKITIMLSCIHGVDLDKKAVEISQLSLLLKLLEGETSESLSKRQETKSVLPMLNDNIRCGNSLIDDSQIAEEKAFKWEEWFKEVMGNGKFDVIIGNPPYVRMQTLDKREVDFFNEKYKSAGKGNYDIYVLFVERALSLLKKDGYLGFILPHKFFTAKYGEPLRKIISDGKYLHEIVHFGDQQVFEGATTYTCLLFLQKQENRNLRFVKVNNLEDWKNNKKAERGTITSVNVTSAEWNFTTGKNAVLFEKLFKMPVKLGSIANIFVGLQTSADTVFLFKDTIISNKKLTTVYSKELKSKVEIETSLLKPVIRSGDIGRYKAIPTAVVLFPYQITNGKAELIPESYMRKNYPYAWKYLNQNKSFLENREHGKFKSIGWYQLYPKNLAMWEQPKILIPYMISDLAAYYDTNNLYFVNVTTGGFGIIIDDNYGKYEYFTGLLNSNLLNWFLKNVSSAFHGGYFAANKQFLVQLPMRTINFSDAKDKSFHDKMIKYVEQMISLNKRLSDLGDKRTDDRERIEQEIKRMNNEIDDLVYKIYGITEDEKKIIEESLR